MENPLQENGPISNISTEYSRESKIQMRIPKRVIHCSDGIIEEFSDDEGVTQNTPDPLIDPKTLPWGSWFLHYAMMGGNKALEYCDYLGEGLAEFFHITTPKYQLEISEYQRQEAAKRKALEESSGWITTNPENGHAMVTIQPSSVSNPTTATL